MDFMTDLLLAKDIKSTSEVTRLLRAEGSMTADAAEERINTLKRALALHSRSGKIAYYSGILVTITAVPLLLLVIGFLFLPIGIACIWWGRKLRRQCDEASRLLDEGLAAHLRSLSPA